MDKCVERNNMPSYLIKMRMCSPELEVKVLENISFGKILYVLSILARREESNPVVVFKIPTMELQADIIQLGL